MRRRNWSTEEKQTIVLEGLRGMRSVAEICREHQISQTLYYRWRDKFLEGARNGLENGSADEKTHRAEIERLQKIIGKQTIEIEILKKTQSMFKGR
jgi:transposase-like protein